MGKMTGADGDRCGGDSRLNLQRGLEAGELRLGKSMEKRLEEDDGLAQAGIEIVVDRVKQFPIVLRLNGLAAGKFFHGGLEGGMELIDKIGEGRDFVKELGFAREENPAEEIIEASDALTPGVLKILRVERGEIGSGAKMLGVLEHGMKQGMKRVGQPLTKSRSNTENLIGLGIATATAHAERFIQAYTEHGIGSFETVDVVYISVGLITLERNAPILRH